VRIAAGFPIAGRLARHLPHGAALNGQQPELQTLFFFFSNRLGCLGSLLVTAIGTLAILFLLGWI
jgi:hypothetical protein